jgi:acetate kinase
MLSPRLPQVARFDTAFHRSIPDVAQAFALPWELHRDGVRRYEVFCYRVSRHIGSLAAALGGLNGVVFTAGVDENAASVRAEICRACAWLGLALDDEATACHGPRISTSESRIHAYVIPTDKNLMIARQAWTSVFE